MASSAMLWNERNMYSDDVVEGKEEAMQIQGQITSQEASSLPFQMTVATIPEYAPDHCPVRPAHFSINVDI
jgi:hypothetical protein